MLLLSNGDLVILTETSLERWSKKNSEWKQEQSHLFDSSFKYDKSAYSTLLLEKTKFQLAMVTPRELKIFSLSDMSCISTQEYNEPLYNLQQKILQA